MAVDREACALYKAALDKVLPPDWSQVVYTGSNNDSERLEEAIESCVNYQDVMDDWLEENSQYADQDPMDAFEESRLDSLMAQLV